MTGFTPEEWRTAARVARRSIFTEGRPDLADAWDKAADQVEAKARMIPADEMRLTAEQVENVRAAREELRGYRNFDGNARGRVNRLIAAVDALFPATEPAEVNGNICTEGNSSPTVVHVHHHDIEAHAASYNEGYDEAMRQLAESESVDIESLIEKSSLGSESAQAAIDTVSPEHGRRVAQMAEQRGKVGEPRITSEGGKRWHLTETEYVEFDAAGDIWINMGPHIKDARKAAAALLAAAEAEDDAAFAAMQGEYPPAPHCAWHRASEVSS